MKHGKGRGAGSVENRKCKRCGAKFLWRSAYPTQAYCSVRCRKHAGEHRRRKRRASE